MNPGNDPMRQQWLANITCYKCRKQGHYRKDCPNANGTTPGPELNIQPYSPQTTVTQTVTVSYAVPRSSSVTFLEGLAKTK